GRLEANPKGRLSLRLMRRCSSSETLFIESPRRRALPEPQIQAAQTLRIEWERSKGGEPAWGRTFQESEDGQIKATTRSRSRLVGSDQHSSQCGCPVRGRPACLSCSRPPARQPARTRPARSVAG